MLRFILSLMSQRTSRNQTFTEAHTVEAIRPAIGVRLGRYVWFDQNGREVRALYTLNGRFCPRATYHAIRAAVFDGGALDTVTQYRGDGAWSHLSTVAK